MGLFFRSAVSNRNPGLAGDTQLSTYFLETDILVTADKALIDILEECRPYAPCQLPEGKLVSGGAPEWRTSSKCLAKLEKPHLNERGYRLIHAEDFLVLFGPELLRVASRPRLGEGHGSVQRSNQF
jgi:hypothetical protein